MYTRICNFLQLFFSFIFNKQNIDYNLSVLIPCKVLTKNFMMMMLLCMVGDVDSYAHTSELRWWIESRRAYKDLFHPLAASFLRLRLTPFLRSPPIYIIWNMELLYGGTWSTTKCFRIEGIKYCSIEEFQNLIIHILGNVINCHSWKFRCCKNVSYMFSVFGKDNEMDLNGKIDRFNNLIIQNYPYSFH